MHRRNWKMFARLAAVVLLASAPSARGADAVRTTPLILSRGGTPEAPAVFDGAGLVIDLGTDVSGHAWKKDGDLWTSLGPLLDREPPTAGQVAGLFVDETPIAIPRDVEAEKLRPDRKSRCYFPPQRLKPGEMGFAEDGSAYFRWPAGRAPGAGRVVLPSKAGSSGVTIACSHIVVRNVTARYAGNDGFNIHGRWIGVRLENVRAFSNADEGISAHDDVAMEVVGAEIAWNGSVAGGVADVNRSTTSYRDCRLHDNWGAAFFFSGKSHAVSDSLIWRQNRDVVVSNGAPVRRERLDVRRELTDPPNVTPNPLK